LANCFFVYTPYNNCRSIYKEVAPMKQVIITAVVFVSLFAFTAPLVRAADYRVGVTEVRPGEKIFKWSENLEGDCHQLGATLKIRTNGTATFDADTWTRTRGTDVWHSLLLSMELSTINWEKVFVLTAPKCPTMLMAQSICTTHISNLLFPLPSSTTLS